LDVSEDEDETNSGTVPYPPVPTQIPIVLSYPTQEDLHVPVGTSDSASLINMTINDSVAPVSTLCDDILVIIDHVITSLPRRSSCHTQSPKYLEDYSS
jgi:hypothetical protein